MGAVCAVARGETDPQEQANLERSIRDMFFAIQAIGVNTNPGPEWRSALFRADLEIERCLAELQDPVKTRVESVATTTDWL
jgi:hypothetical protein